MADIGNGGQMINFSHITIYKRKIVFGLSSFCNEAQ